MAKKCPKCECPAGEKWAVPFADFLSLLLALFIALYALASVNIEKQKALKEEPNNLAYIDTLAWGEYKIKNCQEANKQMKRVVDEVGLNDEEIKLHWEKIKECKK